VGDAGGEHAAYRARAVDHLGEHASGGRPASERCLRARPSVGGEPRATAHPAHRRGSSETSRSV
jgi:hypothetical protein